MKIRRIQLAAYGSFTDVTLDLPDTGPDFHMLFGPNEAGKSTALQALRHMLFGIPVQTSVDFLHGYAKLRVGATLVDSNGGEISFLRRKGRIKTLRGPDDETILDDDALTPFLGGVGADVFEQMFAIGHDDLIQGGEEIISGKGSIGEALFAAGAGLIRLQTVQQDLAQACGALFKPSGSTPAINQAVKAVKQARQEQKNALLLPKTWKENDAALGQAQQRAEQIKESLAAHKQRQAGLERFKEALPLIVRKKEIDEALAAHHGVPDLPDDFGDRRRDAEKELKMAVRDLERSQAGIEKITKAIETLPSHTAMLENAAAVESLQHDLGSYRKARQDRPDREGRMRTLQKQAADMREEIAAEIPGIAARDLKLPPATVKEIQQLGKAFERLTATRDSAGEQQRKRQNKFNRLADQRRALAKPVDVTQLENAMQAAVSAGPIEKQLADMREAAKTIEQTLNRTLKRQTLWNGSLAAIDELPLPSLETIHRFETQFDALQRTLDKQHEAKASTQAEISETQTAIQAIDLSQEVPTETDLKSARSIRDKGWGLIRGKLAGHSPPAEQLEEILQAHKAADLPEAFETSMSQADHIADRLRREADQVSKKGLLEARKEKLAQTLAEATAAHEQTLDRQSRLEDEWRRLWQPIGMTTPQTPREMHGWRSEMATLREKLDDLRSWKSKSEQLAVQRTTLKADLLTAFNNVGAPHDQHAPLTVLVKTARTHIKTQQDLEAAITTADKQLRSLESDLEEGAATLEELETVLSQWQTDWQKSVQKIGIKPDTNPTAALAVIESIRELRSKTSEAEVLHKRIQGIDRDSTEFKQRVDALVDTLAPELRTEPMDKAAEQLNARLTQARKNESKRNDLQERLTATEQELEAANRRRFECQAIIESLCKQAGCTDPQSLAATEERSRERKQLTQTLTDLEQRLRNPSAGETLDTFIQEAQSIDADTITPELQQIEEKTQALEKERSDLDQKIGALKATLEQMDGRSQAALHAEEAERLLAGLESDVEKYARLKIASIILSRTVEQYREKHQGPLISRAGELFSQMTLNAFSRLRADYDDKGNPVLVGIRANTGDQVHVPGMSDGTADQLYLALRLASLEQYLENNEPLPFIVDDILLRFDDDRALATLAVLAELSTKTQVLFFTHHQHLMDMVENSGNTTLGVSFHQLG